MNLDFSAEPLFSWYVVAITVSGLLLLGLGIAGVNVKIGMRIICSLAGLGFLGYAYYLAFVFAGTTYMLYYKIFILPVLLIVAMVKSIVEGNKAKDAQAAHLAPPVAPYNPNAPQAPYNPNAPQAPAAQVPPQTWQPAAPAAPVAPAVPAQPVADNPYAQPAPQPPTA